MRHYPTTSDDNNIFGSCNGGDVFNVYETINNETYTWYRVGNKEWIASDGKWLIQDSKCNRSNGNYEIVHAYVYDYSDGNIGVYENPVGNENLRTWVTNINSGSYVTIYYRFSDGTYNWYKIGADRWIKDHGDRVYIQY